MKNLKLFLTILIGCLFVLVLSACNSCSCSSQGENTNEGGNSLSDSAFVHTHTFESWGKDENGHWKECSCGEKSDLDSHAFTLFQFDETQHWKECVCGMKTEEEQHILGEWIIEQDSHHQACDCGAKLHEGAHSFDEWKCLDEVHWQECVCGEKFGESSHSYSEWSYEGEYHWQECICGNKTQWNRHTLDDFHQCIVCRMYYGSAGLIYKYSQIGDYYIVESDPNEVLLGKIYIASVYEGKTIKGIGMSAFMGQNITEIVLPKSIEVIEKMAFANCKELVNVEWKYGVQKISESTFRNCEKLEELILPSSVTVVENNAFYGCKSLEKIVFRNENDWKAVSPDGEKTYDCPSEVMTGTAKYFTGELLYGEIELNFSRFNLVKMVE